ncbi:MAG TPA: MarR family winged helix-turn-helix transcriptional regulator, partial [Candidatus Dormibacteraeota bacterium]|nr:MarR family winged helix-turn-helix transcriptional regulator [Candidatus Dormibacteraeota bacterium]
MGRELAPAAVVQVRSFNRTVAERVGALTDQFLGRARPMGESRALWEIGDDGIEVRELRVRLGLDSGYTSRVLRSLEHQGMIRVSAAATDRRVRVVRLTQAGREESAELDRRSDAVARGILEPLSDAQRTRMVTAMSEVERLLSASMVTVEAADARSRDARWCIAQYFAELDARFESGFDPAKSIPADAAELTPPAGLIVVARLRGKPVGCGALKFHSGAPAELKRMWVAREVRGLGLGRRLLAELEMRAVA